MIYYNLSGARGSKLIENSQLRPLCSTRNYATLWPGSLSEGDMSNISIPVRLVLIVTLLTIGNTSFRVAANGISHIGFGAPIAHRQTDAAAQQTYAAALCANPYTVRQGDTLSRIAGRCGVSTAQLRQWNGLRTNTIWVGQSLITRAPTYRRPVATPMPLQVWPTPAIESTVSPW